MSNTTGCLRKFERQSASGRAGTVGTNTNYLPLPEAGRKLANFSSTEIGTDELACCSPSRGHGRYWENSSLTLALHGAA